MIEGINKTLLPQNGINRFLFVMIVLLSLTIFVAFLYIWLGYSKLNINDGNINNSSAYSEFMTMKFNSASDYLNDNNANEAVLVFDEMLARAEDDATIHALTIRKASALFSTGDIPSAYEAVDILGALLDSENIDPMFRGWAISELLQFHFLSQHSGILEKIRQLSVFSKWTDLNVSDFLLEAAKLSDTLYPTTFGKIYLATPLAMQLTHSNLSQGEAEVLAKEIEFLTKESVTLQQDEVWSKAPYNKMLTNHYRGIVLSVATEGGTDPDLATQEFTEAIEYVNDNPSIASVQKLSLFTHFYFASHLLKSGFKDMADAQLTDLIRKINSTHSLDFKYFVETVYSNKESNNYKLFQSLSAHSLDFKNLLQTKYQVVFN